jgi:hypothetical protein
MTFTSKMVLSATMPCANHQFPLQYHTVEALKNFDATTDEDLGCPQIADFQEENVPITTASLKFFAWMLYLQFRDKTMTTAKASLFFPKFTEKK